MSTPAPVYCTHSGATPTTKCPAQMVKGHGYLLAHVLPGGIVTVPWCVDARRIPREHLTEGTP